MSTQSQHQQQQQQNQSKPPSFDTISKHFSFPLSDAANNLGVCVSVLKKICRENGLDRWPYRKYLAGKSIEDIKRHAAREKIKSLTELVKANSNRSGFQHQNNENSKPQGAAAPHKLQQQGSKDVPGGRPIAMPTQGSTKGLMGLDEFKNGFPSGGLSTTTNKWWGSSEPDGNRVINGDGAETDEDDSHQSEGKSDDGTILVAVDQEKPRNGKMVNEIDPQGTGLLTAARKRAVEEGREAHRIGVHRTLGVNKLGRKERALLLRIFGSSLPKQWIFDSC